MNEMKFDPELVSSLIKAKAGFPDIKKTKTGRDGNRLFKYADLSDTLNAINPILHKYDLILLQPISYNDGSFLLETTIIHKNGSSFSKSIPIPISGIKPKDAGGVITYYRRYEVNAFFGINADEDTELEMLDDKHPSNQIIMPQQKTPVVMTKPAIAAPKASATKDFDDEDIPF